jgi:DNA polymerase III subunit gamma/tau
MAYQSLYRRYRSQTFGELIGQDHISGALRNAVRTNTVMHAYLFSGPRGTGKTSSARILAKALNCTDPQDGEPCNTCAACKEVTAGTSMDVNELDAASNNGVDAMRDLVSRAALGTAGRRKVYIVDEVHMLSTAASNALLKTLEEPPEHVVFVLATTDPQKVLRTIVSRTQHFEFKLVSVPLLTKHLRWVASDAKLELDDSVFEIVARRGNGSVRDALSALDQVVAAGGVDDAVPALDAVLGGLADRDPGALLEAVATAVDRGREPRQFARDLIERLRQVFLAALAPALVDPAATDAPEWAAKLQPAALTRAIEVLGEALVAMRDSLDPRINLEIALVRLSRPELDTSSAALVERLDRLERMLAAGVPPVAIVPPSPLAATAHPAVGRSEPAVGTLAPPPGNPGASRPPARSGAADGARAALAGKATPAKGAGAALDAKPLDAKPSGVPTAGSMSAAEAAGTTGVESDMAGIVAAWPDVLERLRVANNRAKVLFALGQVMSVVDDEVTIGLPNEMHRQRCEEYRGDVERALHEQFGRVLRLRLAVDPSGGSSSGPAARDEMPPPEDEPPAAPIRRVERPPAPVASAPRTAPSPARDLDDDIAEIDLSELTEASDVAVHSTFDQLLRAFPGAQLVEETFPK